MVERLIGLLESQLPHLDARIMSNSLSALAKIRPLPITESFVSKLCLAAECELPNFNSQGLANTIWALAKLEPPNTEAFVYKLLSAAECKLPDFKPQELSNTLWALAKLDRCLNIEAFVITLLSAAERKLPGFNAQDLAITVWALATLRHHDGGFISSIAQRALDFKLGAKHISQLVLGISSLGYDESAFYSSIGSQLMSCPDVGLQAVCNVFHGLAMAGLHPPWASELLMDRLPALMLPIGASKQTDMGFAQAFHYILMLKARGLLSFDIQSSEAYVQMRERCRLGWIAETGISTIFRHHREVFEVLRQLPGCSGAICERKTEDGLFSMGIGVELPSSSSEGRSVRVAIEVDGPSHFMSDKPDMATGETTTCTTS